MARLGSPDECGGGEHLPRRVHRAQLFACADMRPFVVLDLICGAMHFIGKKLRRVSVGTRLAPRRAAGVFAAAKPQICTMSIAKVPSSEALRVRADRGDAEAAFQLAAYHGGGQAWLAGIPKDEQVAARYYKQACDGGHTEAAFHVAMCYHTGSGVEKSPEQALEYYRIAASNGHLEAQKSLVTCYSTGSGCSVDQAMAARYCRHAAEQGDDGMMFATAERFATGSGCTKDQDKANYYYKLAAEAGHKGANEVLDRRSETKFRLERPWGCSWNDPE